MTITTQTVETKIKNRIYGKGRGWVFTQKDFYDLGGYFAIRKTLLNFAHGGLIRRIAQGLYEYPRYHERLGELPPSLASVADAIARRDQIKIQPSGALSANLLGLSEQVPAKVVYLTNGNSKVIKIHKQEIRFRKTTPRRMSFAQKTSGLVIEALRYLGKDGVTPKAIQSLKRKLTASDKLQLRKDAREAPAWIARVILKEICDADSA